MKEGDPGRSWRPCGTGWPPAVTWCSATPPTPAANQPWPRPARTVYNRNVATKLHLRPRAGIERLFAGYELVDPGLVYATMWRPNSPEDIQADLADYGTLVGVARKP